MADILKLIVAAAIVAASLVGFYFYEEEVQLLYRALGMLTGVVVAMGIALTSEKGREVSAFMRGSVVEIKKVVWPTRKETVNTTIMVIVMVIIVGLMLWGFDSVLGMLVRHFTGQEG